MHRGIGARNVPAEDLPLRVLQALARYKASGMLKQGDTLFWKLAQKMKENT